MTSTREIADPMERLVAAALTKAGVPFTMDPRETADLDFRILNAPVYIEVKQMHSDRIAGQMARANNVIAVQGRGAVTWFAALFIEEKEAMRERAVTAESELELWRSGRRTRGFMPNGHPCIMDHPEDPNAEIRDSETGEVLFPARKAPFCVIEGVCELAKDEEDHG